MHYQTDGKKPLSFLLEGSLSHSPILLIINIQPIAKTVYIYQPNYCPMKKNERKYFIAFLLFMCTLNPVCNDKKERNIIAFNITSGIKATALKFQHGQY